MYVTTDVDEDLEDLFELFVQLRRFDLNGQDIHLPVLTFPPHDNYNVWRDQYLGDWLRLRDHVIRTTFSNLCIAWHVVHSHAFTYPRWPNPLYGLKDWCLVTKSSVPFQTSIGYLSPVFTPPFVSDFSTPADLQEVNKRLLDDRPRPTKRRRL